VLDANTVAERLLRMPREGAHRPAVHRAPAARPSAPPATRFGTTRSRAAPPGATTCTCSSPAASSCPST
jgi:hypothetical protein